MRAKLVRESLMEVNRTEDAWADQEIDKWQGYKKASDPSRKKPLVKPNSRGKLINAIATFAGQLQTGYGWIGIQRPTDVDGEDPLFRSKKNHTYKYYKEFLEYLINADPGVKGQGTLGSMLDLFDDVEISDIYDFTLGLVNQMDTEEEDNVRGEDGRFHDDPDFPGRDFDEIRGIIT